MSVPSPWPTTTTSTFMVKPTQILVGDHIIYIPETCASFQTLSQEGIFRRQKTTSRSFMNSQGKKQHTIELQYSVYTEISLAKHCGRIVEIMHKQLKEHNLANYLPVLQRAATVQEIYCFLILLQHSLATSESTEMEGMIVKLTVRIQIWAEKTRGERVKW